MTFQGQQRGDAYKGENNKRILELFEGFQCEVQCKASDSSHPTVNQSTTTRPSSVLTILNTTTARIPQTKPTHSSGVR